MKNFDINQHHPLITAYHILITTKVIHPIVSHLPGLLLLDDVINLDVITQTENVEHLNVPNVSTAHHTPPLMKNILTEVTHHDVTNLHGLFHLVVLPIHSVVEQQQK